MFFLRPVHFHTFIQFSAPKFQFFPNFITRIQHVELGRPIAQFHHKYISCNLSSSGRFSSYRKMTISFLNSRTLQKFPKSLHCNNIVTLNVLQKRFLTFISFTSTIFRPVASLWIIHCGDFCFPMLVYIVIFQTLF